jgi:hypothetical protein
MASFSPRVANTRPARVDSEGVLSVAVVGLFEFMVSKSSTIPLSETPRELVALFASAV